MNNLIIQNPHKYNHLIVQNPQKDHHFSVFRSIIIDSFWEVHDTCLPKQSPLNSTQDYKHSDEHDYETRLQWHGGKTPDNHLHQNRKQWFFLPRRMPKRMRTSFHQSSVDYGNTKIASMHLYPPKTECGCPSGGRIKNGCIRYPSYGGTQKKKKNHITDTRLWLMISKVII